MLGTGKSRGYCLEMICAALRAEWQNLNTGNDRIIAVWLTMGSTSRKRMERKRSSDIMLAMAKNIIHISEAEAASDFAAVLARVRAGAEIVIEDDARPVAVVRPAEPHVRWLSESLRLAKEHASTATLDEDFARDLEEVINSHREPLNPPAWD